MRGAGPPPRQRSPEATKAGKPGRGGGSERGGGTGERAARARGELGAQCGVAAPPRKGRRKAEGGVSQCAGVEWQEASSLRLCSGQALSTALKAGLPYGRELGGTAHHPHNDPRRLETCATDGWRRGIGECPAPSTALRAGLQDGNGRTATHRPSRRLLRAGSGAKDAENGRGRGSVTPPLRLRSGQAYRTATAERLFTALRGGYSGQAPAQRARRTAGGASENAPPYRTTTPAG